MRLFLGVGILFLICNMGFSWGEGTAIGNTERVALMTFDYSGPNTVDVEILTETFQTELVNNPNKKFSLVERAQISKVMAEQKFNLQGLTADDKAVKIGQLAGAHKIIIGKISFWEGKYIINVKAVDTTSAVVAFAERVETFDKAYLMDLMPILSDRFIKRSLGQNLEAYRISDDEMRRLDERKRRREEMERQKRDEEERQRRERENRNRQNYDSYYGGQYELSLEVGGYMGQNFSPAMGSYIYGFNAAMKGPGNGFFQFALGMDIFTGMMDMQSSFHYLTFYSGFQLNLLDTPYVRFGLGIAYAFAGGSISYKELLPYNNYNFNYAMDALRINAEFGFHIIESIILKAEVIAFIPTGFRLLSGSDNMLSSSATTYPMRDEDYRLIYVPSSVYNIRDGMPFIGYGIKLDLMF